MKRHTLVVVVLLALAASALGQSSFSRFNFTAGGGLGIGRTYVAAFSGDSYHGVAGGGINFSRMFGIDAEYMYYDLSIRPSVAYHASLNHTSGRLQSVSLNAIVNAPLHSRFGAYGIFGAGFYRRSVSANTQVLADGAPCQPIWSRWYGINCIGSINPVVSPQQTLSSLARDAGGFNIGGGVTYRLNHLGRARLFTEVRLHRAYHSDAQTSVIPVTVGLRW